MYDERDRGGGAVMETPPLVTRALTLAESSGLESSCRPEDGAVLHVLAARERRALVSVRR